MAIKKEFKDMTCQHNVSFSGYMSKAMRSIVFTSPKAGMTYIWITSGGSEYVEGEVYDFTAECDDTRRILSRVKQIKKPHLKVDIDEEVINSWNAMNASEKSEQPDSSPRTPVDIFNLIYDIKE